MECIRNNIPLPLKPLVIRISHTYHSIDYCIRTYSSGGAERSIKHSRHGEGEFPQIKGAIMGNGNRLIHSRTTELWSVREAFCS